MARYVNPFTDLGFKIIFGQPASKELLITLLNELLSGEHHVVDLTFLDKEDHSENLSDKGIVYDLYCRTSTGDYLIVEMQKRHHSYFLDRTLYYTCRAISRQIDKPSARDVEVPESSRADDFGFVRESEVGYGSKYKLDTVYGIFLMDFKEMELEGKFRTDTVIADRDTGRVVHPHFRQIYLQFPYFTKELDECDSLYERLMYTLKNLKDWKKMPDTLKDQVFKRLEQLAAVANLSEADRIAYDRAVDSYYVSKVVESDIREEGIREGMKAGREEFGKQIVRRMKAMKLSVEQIMQATGLSEEEIRNNK